MQAVALGLAVVGLVAACAKGSPNIRVVADLEAEVGDSESGPDSSETQVGEGAEESEAPCTPDCTGKSCGDPDGCSGKCVAEAGCDDSNPCTLDSCSAGGECVHGPQEGTCDDGNPCTEGDSCKEGQCAAGTDPVSCDDTNVCTDDSCDPESGCMHDPIVGACDDENPCTDDDKCVDGYCNPGKAVPDCCMSAEDCDDGNTCTKDSCDNPGPNSSCIHTPTPGAQCNDGNDKTQNDTCLGDGGIICIGLYPVTCGDAKCEFPENAKSDPEDPKKPAVPGDLYFCPIDCGPCGDTVCGKLETQESCCPDCCPVCGDGKCQSPEQAGNPDEKTTYCVLDCGGCGDQFCGFNESFTSCAGDCPATCGDGKCEGTDSADNCPMDCTPPCGDLTCSKSETSYTCPKDCGYCGDGVCVLEKETAVNCDKDCVTACGNGICEGGEKSWNCAVDCGSCGDEICGKTESAETCVLDCVPTCGNGKCDAGETASTCFVDCCVQKCQEKHCGPDGCGGVCGICPEGLSCNEVAGLCE